MPGRLLYGEEADMPRLVPQAAVESFLPARGLSRCCIAAPLLRADRAQLGALLSPICGTCRFLPPVVSSCCTAAHGSRVGPLERVLPSCLLQFFVQAGREPVWELAAPLAVPLCP